MAAVLEQLRSRPAGLFFPPTLFTDVSPASTIAQVEIFGPVLAAMSFRTPDEAVELANNTTYGLAASVWTENVNLALHVAARIQAGTVWINSTNLFDAASGFGGYRESGFGREGGAEGVWEYVRPAWDAERHLEHGRGPSDGPAPDEPSATTPSEPRADSAPELPELDRTAKMYIGGKQARPDAPYSRPVYGPDGRLVGEVGEGNRKDLRNAVEAARQATGSWGRAAAHLRAQILYYVAENLGPRRTELAGRLAAMTGAGDEAVEREVGLSIERLFSAAAWADKYAGTVQATPRRNFTFGVHEPIGTLAILCPDDWPLLAFVSTLGPALAMGNCVVTVPSPRHPLAATDLYQVFDTSDVPGGVVNIVTGDRDALGQVLARHDDVDCLWHFGTREEGARVEERSAGNLKRTWCDLGLPRDWSDPEQGAGEEFLRQAIQVKNIWTPFGE